MPFTPAHTAAVLPFIRSRYVSATGLVMGSIAPDFEYFIKFSVAGVHGHTWPGLLYFDLPVAFLISVLFHAVVKRNLVLSLPGFIQSRFVDILDAGFIAGMKRNPLRFIFSALAGSATHIIWDGFTHNGGFFVDYFTFLMALSCLMTE